jgi:hypothetical protein
MAPQFTKPQVRRYKAHEESPAQKLRLTTKLLKFGDIFDLRSLERNIKTMCEDWNYFWQAQVPPKYHRSLKFTV